ncbi:MAG: sulfotransferase [Pseudomonadota bacterium]
MFYFVIGPNNSGTTVVCQYLAAQTGAYLPPFGHNEGQFAPAVRDMMRLDPWNAKAPIDWAFVRREWESLLRDSGKTAFVEGSPPNLLRADAMLEAFAPDYRAMFLIANPYMSVASNLKNYAVPPLGRAQMDTAVADWLRKAQRMRENARRWPDIPLVRYEDFCIDPSIVAHAFGFDGSARARVAGKKTTGAREIRDMTVRNMAFLKPVEADALSDRLAPHVDLLEFFGYDLLDANGFADQLSAAPDLADQGRATRAGWARRQAVTAAVRWGRKQAMGWRSAWRGSPADA